MLAIRCQFLLGTYQAAAPGLLTEPEWPPHPARLHAALVAAGWALGGPEFPTDVRDALRWLEAQPPPKIAEPQTVGARDVAPVYVPRNPTPREITSAHGHLRAGRIPAFQRDSGRVERVFPARVPGDEPVWFVWRDAEPPEELSAGLERAVAAIQYLGSSRSPVACAVAADPPQPTIVPVDGQGRVVVRVPYEGLTDGLIAARNGRVRDHLRATAPYGPPEAPAQTVARGPFGQLVILGRTKGFALGVQHAVLVSRALRSAALAQAGDDAPDALHGHGRHPHAAFLALPNAGHPSSTGELLGVAVAIPAWVSEEDRDAVVHAITSVRALTLNGSIAPWELSPVGSEPDRRTLDPARWIGPARHWRTVTPIVLDRHPKREETVEDMLRLSCSNALLPEPEEVRVSRYPFVGGAVAAPMHGGHGAPGGLAVHAEVVFAQEIRGPLVAGRGRYMGLGLLAPDRGRDSGD